MRDNDSKDDIIWLCSEERIQSSLCSSCSGGRGCHAGGFWWRVKRRFTQFNIASTRWNHSVPNTNTTTRTTRNAPSAPKDMDASLCGETIHKEIGEGCQLLFLGDIDIQRFIIQPVIGVDTDVSLFIRINDKGVSGILVPVGF